MRSGFLRFRSDKIRRSRSGQYVVPKGDRVRSAVPDEYRFLRPAVVRELIALDKDTPAGVGIAALPPRCPWLAQRQDFLAKTDCAMKVVAQSAFLDGIPADRGRTAVRQVYRVERPDFDLIHLLLVLVVYTM